LPNLKQSRRSPGQAHIREPKRVGGATLKACIFSVEYLRYWTGKQGHLKNEDDVGRCAKHCSRHCGWFGSPAHSTMVGENAISSKSKRLKRISDEYDLATYFALHPEFLACKLVLTCLGVCVYIVYLLFLVKIDVTPIPHGPWFPKPSFTIPGYIFTLVDVGNMLFLTILTIFIGRTGLNAFSFFERVRNFKNYVENVPIEIRDIPFEKLDIAIAKERPMSPLSMQRPEDLGKSIKEGKESTDTSGEATS
jgi:hypothetical protein